MYKKRQKREDVDLKAIQRYAYSGDYLRYA